MIQQRHVTRLAFFAVILALAVPGALASQSGSFSVTATVSNSAPVITAVNYGFTLTPTEDATGLYQFYFNASDANGGTDINASTATIVVNRSGQVSTSSGCTGSVAGNDVAYNCSVGLPYYYLPGTYSINASVSDDSAAYAENTTQTFTYNTLKAIKLTLASLSFNGGPGQLNISANEGPQYVRNTGNYNFIQLNVTGININSSTTTIGVGNFSVNITNGQGQALLNNTPVTVADFALNAGNNTNTTLYFHMDIPASAPSATYVSASNWIVDAN